MMAYPFSAALPGEIASSHLESTAPSLKGKATKNPAMRSSSSVARMKYANFEADAVQTSVHSTGLAQAIRWQFSIGQPAYHRATELFQGIDMKVFAHRCSLVRSTG